MADKPLDFLIAENISVDEIKSTLQTLMPFSEEPRNSLRRRYYDTFDWRFYHQGDVLEEQTCNGERTLSWRSLTNGALHGGLRVSETPRFVWEFPQGPLRERLEPILKMRILLPRVTVASTLCTLRVLNRDDKTILRVVIEENRVSAPNGESTARLGGRVRVLPVKGYGKPFEFAAQAIEEKIGLVPETEDLMVSALRALGRQPGDYSSRLELELDPTRDAASATKRILRHLCNTMKANEAGTRADLDSEFLHDFRVAIRRTRSALSQIKGVFPQSLLEHFRPEFTWLGQATGPTRDLDVYLLNFPEYQASLPTPVRADLEPLYDFFKTRQHEEQQALAETLGCPRYRRLMRDWSKFLKSPSSASAETPNAERPVGEVAGHRIWRVSRRVLKEGQAIGPETPAADLHELRKTCKKLRYLMEFFQSFYPAAEIRKLIKALKGLQQNLGDFQDLEVQVQNLRQFSGQMAEIRKVPAATLLAMGMLVADLSNRQQQVREEFAVRFAAFAAPENKDLFQQLFASYPKKGAPDP